MVLPKIGVWSGAGGLSALPVAEVRSLVSELTELGYGMVWFPESLGRESMSFAATLLASDPCIRVGTSIANIWARDPIAMANGARTLDEAYGERFVLGIGVSHEGFVSPRGHDYSSPLHAMRLYLDRMKGAPWTGPDDGDRGVPRLLAALGPRMLELAAEAADGAQPYLVTAEHTAGARAILGPDGLLAPEQSVVICSDPVHARLAARRHLATYLQLANYRQSFLRQGFEASDLEGGGSDRLVDGIVAWGDEEVILERIREHFDAGADHVAIQAVPVEESGQQLDTLRRLAASQQSAPSASIARELWGPAR